MKIRPASVIWCGIVAYLIFCLAKLLFKSEILSLQRPTIIRHLVRKDVPQQQDRIFFHETSGANFLIQKHLCAVESAAFHNPLRKVQLFLHSSRAPRKCSSWMNVIEKYPNIEVVLLNETLFFKDTPFNDWYQFYISKDRTPKQFATMSEYARIINSLKGGGTYLDLDMLVIRPLDTSSLGNFFVFGVLPETIDIASGAYHLSNDHKILREVADFMKNNYRASVENGTGHLATAINHVLRQHCAFPTDADVEQLSSRLTYCSQVKLLPYWAFNPFSWEVPDIHYLFGVWPNKEAFDQIRNMSLAVHLWDSTSYNMPILYQLNLTVSFLSKENCPHTVAEVVKQDGV